MKTSRIISNKCGVLKYVFALVFFALITLFWLWSYYGGAINLAFGRDPAVHIPIFIAKSGIVHQAGFRVGALIAYMWCVAGLFNKYLFSIVRLLCLLTALFGSVVVYNLIKLL